VCANNSVNGYVWVLLKVPNNCTRLIGGGAWKCLGTRWSATDLHKFLNQPTLAKKGRLIEYSTPFADYYHHLPSPPRQRRVFCDACRAPFDIRPHHLLSQDNWRCPRKTCGKFPCVSVFLRCVPTLYVQGASTTVVGSKMYLFVSLVYICIVQDLNYE
jgi:hypothetical protein